MDANGKFAVMIMHDPEAHKNGKPVPRFALTPDGQEVRVFDKYKEADAFKLHMKGAYPTVWYAITKVYLPSEPVTVDVGTNPCAEINLD